MDVSRKRPTSSVWYSSFRAANVYLLIVATSLVVALLIKRELGPRTIKEPLTAVVLAVIPNVFELYTSLCKDAFAFRSTPYLASFITIDLVFAGGLCSLALWTGAEFYTKDLIPSTLFCILLVLPILHLVTMSFLAHEHRMKRKQKTKQKAEQKAKQQAEQIAKRNPVFCSRCRCLVDCAANPKPGCLELPGAVEQR